MDIVKLRTFDNVKLRTVNVVRPRCLHHLHTPLHCQSPISLANMQQVPAVVAPHYCAPYAVEFTVVKQALSFSGGDFLINDSNGNVFFRVDGRILSIRDKRVLLDGQGIAVLSAQRKLLTLHDTWIVHRGGSIGEGDKLFTVKKSSVIQFIRTSLDVFLAWNNSNTPDFKLKGNYLDRSCTVFHGNQPIAEVKRKFTASSVLLGKDTFSIIIFPGIDCAFIAMLIVVMDEIHRQETQSN